MSTEISQEEMDKEVIKLYQARVEGKVIQYICDTEKWHNAPSNAVLAYGYRVKPKIHTVFEAAQLYIDGNGALGTVRDTQYTAFIGGAKWQKEQDNEK